MKKLLTVLSALLLATSMLAGAGCNSAGTSVGTSDSSDGGGNSSVIEEEISIPVPDQEEVIPVPDPPVNPRNPNCPQCRRESLPILATSVGATATR